MNNKTHTSLLLVKLNNKDFKFLASGKTVFQGDVGKVAKVMVGQFGFKQQEIISAVTEMSETNKDIAHFGTLNRTFMFCVDSDEAAS